LGLFSFGDHAEDLIFNILVEILSLSFGCFLFSPCCESFVQIFGWHFVLYDIVPNFVVFLLFFCEIFKEKYVVVIFGKKKKTSRWNYKK
jgi:cell shape-determining protein MreD